MTITPDVGYISPLEFTSISPYFVRSEGLPPSEIDQKPQTDLPLRSPFPHLFTVLTLQPSQPLSFYGVPL